MMSSEDECGELTFVEKSFKNKPKRIRQRVDAGEPRNSYAAIPNFTSRPTNGYIVSSAGSKLISDLLARQRAATESLVCGMMTVEETQQQQGGHKPNKNNNNNESSNVAAAAAAYINEESTTDIFLHHHHHEELTDNSHLLRSILQDRQNFEEACRISPCSSTSEGGEASEGVTDSEEDSSQPSNLLLSSGGGGGGGGESFVGHGSEIAARCGSAPPSSARKDDDGTDDDRMSSAPLGGRMSPDEESCNSRSPSPKSIRADIANCGNSSMEIKRARVETIVSNMIPGLGGGISSAGRSPSGGGGGGGAQGDFNTPVNGCKKRKLYQPQQHEASKTNGETIRDDEEDDDDDGEEDQDELDEEEDDEEAACSPPPAKKVSDPKRLQSELLTLQKQLSSMQQKYLELFEATRVESPVRSDDPELTSVEEQINRDCETERQTAAAHRNREENLSNGLPNVYFHSTPKERINLSLKENNNDEGGGRHYQHHHHHQQQQQQHHHHHHHQHQQRHEQREQHPQHGGGGESRQSCIVKTTSSSGVNSQPVSPSSSTTDLEWLVDALKSEISSTLSQVIDSIVSKYAQRRTTSVVAPKVVARDPPVAIEPPPAPPSQPQPPIISKEFNLLSQMLDRKSPRTKVIDRGNRVNGHASQRLSPYQEHVSGGKGPLFFSPSLKGPLASFFCGTSPHLIAAPPNVVGQSYHHHHPIPSLATSNLLTTTVNLSNQNSLSASADLPEQTEAMSLVVAPKKKRHKVTDTRITPRTVSRLLGQELDSPSKYQHLLGLSLHDHPLNYHLPQVLAPPPPPPLVPVSLPTTVAIPNPSLHQSDVFGALQQYEAHRLGHYSQEQMMDEDSLLHGGSPSMHSSMLGGPHGSPDSMQHYGQFKQENGDGSDAGDSQNYDSGLNMTSTLTPMHLRKAKLMFFYVRYPSSAILKMYFPDIKFNKNNTAQLVKWFSNFREFYYIQMEKYARQSISDGIKSCEEIKVSADAELLRVLNLHYNRNNHIEVPENFRYVVEQTLREFFKAVLAGKDSEQSWKKAIYKVIARLDDGVPDYFKSPNFLEQLE